MIDVALAFVVTELNAWLRARTASDFGAAQLRAVVDDAGKWTEPKDHLLVSLVNVEEERTLRSQQPREALVEGRHVVLQPDVKLDLSVLVAAHFRQYDQALRFLSHVFTFFQGRPGFTQTTHAGLDPRIEKLTAELQTLGLEQWNQLWATVGAKQLPAAVYRLRLLVVQDVEPSEVRPPITSVVSEVHPR